MNNTSPTAGRHGDPANARTDVAAPYGVPAAATDRIPAAVPPKQRGTSGRWFAILLALVVGVAFVVFVLQNSSATSVAFLGWHGTIPLSLALLIAAFAGVLVTAAVSTGRSALRRRKSK